MNHHLSSFSVRTALPVLVAILAPWGNVNAGEPAFCGFNNDNTGVWPVDCTPVTTWGEADFKKVEIGKDGRDKPIFKEVLDKENRQNIVWKTPLPMNCNGGMAIGAGKLFMLNDPGGKGFAGGVKPDFLGVRIYCLDANTGKQVWTDDMHHIDLLPAGEQDKVRTTLKEVRDFNYEVLGIHLRWQSCWHRGHGMVEINEANRASYAAIAAEYRKHIPAVPATLDELPVSSFGKPEYVQVKFGKIVRDQRKDIVDKINYLLKFGYRYNDFFGQGSFIEDAFATPVTDGKNVWAVTFYGDAFCYDLDGKLVWKQWYGSVGTRMTSITSPILVGDLLIFAGCPVEAKATSKAGQDCWMAVNKATGKLVWATFRQGGMSYPAASPTLHRLAIGGDAAKPLDVLWCPTGQVLRVSDGKVLAKELGSHGNSRPWAVQGDVLVIENGSSDGGQGKAQTFPEGTVAFRLTAPDADTAKAEQLWLQAKGSAACRLVARNGILYGFIGRGDKTNLTAFDLLTGKVLKETSAPSAGPHHLSCLAGSSLFAMKSDGFCGVFGLDAQGLPNNQNAKNRLGLRPFGSYDFFNEGSEPAFSGNRVFIRSYTDVYCLGDPVAPMQLSATHR